MTRRLPSLRADLTAALAAVMAVLVLMALGYAAVWPLAADVGGRDQRFALGFNEAETSPAVNYRWTDGDSTLALPRPPAITPAVLALRLQNGRPGAQPPAQVTLSADGRELANLELRDNLFRTYHVLVPPQERLDWALRVRLQSDSILLAADPRPLGVVLDRATLAPAGGIPLPPAALALWAAALGALGFVLPRLAGLGRTPSLALAAALGALVAALVAAMPLDVLPFVQRFVGAAAIGCLGLVTARLIAPPAQTEDEGSRTTHLPEMATQGPNPAGTARGPRSFTTRPPSVKGEHLPIYMAVAWWMMPLFQLFMIWDQAPGVGLAPQTLWIGGGLLTTLAALGLWHMLAGRRAALGPQHAALKAHGSALTAQ
ncbi:MAG: hypothetical protein RLZZ387_215, partial [Chloroflexota bacterium]